MPLEFLEAAILVGGQSRRLADRLSESPLPRSKALLRVGSRTILERQIRVLKPLCRRVFLVARPAGAEAGWGFAGLPVVEDDPGADGALAGLVAALEACRTSRLLVLACDLPFLEGAFVRLLVKESEGAQAVVPRHGGRAHPLAALYSRQCARPLREALDRGVRSPTDALPLLKVRFLEEELGTLDPEGWFLFNVNSPQDYETACRHEREVPAGSP